MVAQAPQSPEQLQPFQLSQALGCSRSLFRVSSASAARRAQLSQTELLCHTQPIRSAFPDKHSSRRKALLLPPVRGLSLQVPEAEGSLWLSLHVGLDAQPLHAPHVALGGHAARDGPGTGLGEPAPLPVPQPLPPAPAWERTEQ